MKKKNDQGRSLIQVSFHSAIHGDKKGGRLFYKTATRAKKRGEGEDGKIKSLKNSKDRTEEGEAK